MAEYIEREKNIVMPLLNKIHNVNCVEGMKQLPDNFVDLTVTSPPYDNLRTYNNNIKQWNFDKFKEIARELYRVTKEGGVVVWVVADATIKGSETGSSFKQALFFKDCGFNLYDTMIWKKPNPAIPTEGRYYNAFEYMFILSKGKPKAMNFICDRKNKRCGEMVKKSQKVPGDRSKKLDKKFAVAEFSRRHNVWEIAISGCQTGHPAIFPIRLAKDHILSWSNEGDIVLDPFIGSGTTAVACINTNRQYIGFEISDEYCKIANERINNILKEGVDNG